MLFAVFLYIFCSAACSDLKIYLYFHGPPNITVCSLPAAHACMLLFNLYAEKHRAKQGVNDVWLGSSAATGDQQLDLPVAGVRTQAD